MCGIVGFLNTQGNDRDSAAILKTMSSCLRHRGPDDEGTWIDPEAGIALGHRRLSIIDLSPLGHQPMHSASGRYVLSFNGEIYNFPELRQELEADPHTPPFRGRSDTEVMLAAFEKWGVYAALQRLVGMFAFAVWDRQARQLLLARDRLGEKPLYYGWMGKTFLFGSELKALRAHPDWCGEVSRDVLITYLRYMYIPGPYSIYQGIYKLPPGTMLCISASDTSLADPTPYWSLRTVIEDGKNNPFQGSEGEAVEELKKLLTDAIRGQMIADVPLGAFLSGGIDSSTVVALMQSQSSLPVKTFSIGFAEETYNEAPFARQVAAHLKTDHTELYVTPKDALELIPDLPTHWDEPFADSSQIPTLLLSKLTRQHVTVSLSGDGGDELFAGYERYFALRDTDWEVNQLPQWQKTTLNLMPSKMRGGLARGLRLAGNKKILAYLDQIYSMPHRTPYSPEAYYRLAMFTTSGYSQGLVTDAHEVNTILTDQSRWIEGQGVIERATYFDMLMYLPDDILVKVDRASMSVALESRVPMLDHRVVEFSERLPMSMKMRGDQGKWILRQILYQYVPQELVDRPKMGFGVPIEHWLRNELKDWAEALLEKSRLRSEGYFAPDLVGQLWTQYQAGSYPHEQVLWNILMFQAWLEKEH